MLNFILNNKYNRKLLKKMSNRMKIVKKKYLEAISASVVKNQKLPLDFDNFIGT